MTPFTIGNMASCPGTVTEIEGEEPMNYWLVIIDEVKSFEHEQTKDRSEFLTYDFFKFDLYGEVLADTQLVPQGQLLRKYTYQKKHCKESWPGRQGTLYGDNLEFFEMIAPFESFDTSHLEYRQEWRTFFADTLQLQIREGDQLENIVSLEERKAQRKAYEDQKEEELQQRRAA